MRIKTLIISGLDKYFEFRGIGAPMPTATLNGRPAKMRVGGDLLDEHGERGVSLSFWTADRGRPVELETDTFTIHSDGEYQFST